MIKTREAIMTKPLGNHFIQPTDTFAFDVDSVVNTPNAKIINLDLVTDAVPIHDIMSMEGYKFMQTEAFTNKGVGIQPYGAIVIPVGIDEFNIPLTVTIGENVYISEEGVQYSTKTGDSFNFNFVEPEYE